MLSYNHRDHDHYKNKLKQIRNHHQDQDSDDQNQGEHKKAFGIKQIHGSVMIFAWFALLHIGIWAHYFRNYRYAIVVHIVCMSCIVILSTIGCTVMLTQQGTQIIYESFFHQTVGFYLIVGLLPITVINGGITKIFLSTFKIQPMSVLTVKQLHKIFGWLMVGLIKIPLITGLAQDQMQVAVFVIIVDAISYGFYWYFKTYGKFASVSINQKYRRLVGQAKYLTTLEQYRSHFQGKCFIFANYLYKIQNVLNFHPGGSTFIIKIRNRQIERFIYGMQLTQDLTNKTIERYTHSPQFLNLAEHALGKITIKQPFMKLKEQNPVYIYNIYNSTNEEMFIVNLKLRKKLEQAQYGPGYEDINQLGRFHAFTVNDLTRLYSVVYCLLPHNIKWMNAIIGTQDTRQFSQYVKYRNQDQSKGFQLSSALLDNSMEHDQNIIPIFIRKYSNGAFTSKLINRSRQISQNNLIISDCRGFGLGLRQLSSSERQKIVVFIGGTGLNPYLDLIDLLYKRMLVLDNHKQSSMLIQNNPIVEKSMLDQYYFIFYIGIQSLHHMHPITLYQCQQLTKNSKIECYIKSRQYINTNTDNRFSMSRIHVLPLTYRFEFALEKQLANDPAVIFHICGTPIMTKGLVLRVRELGLSQNQFRIM